MRYNFYVNCPIPNLADPQDNAHYEVYLLDVSDGTSPQVEFTLTANSEEGFVAYVAECNTVNLYMDDELGNPIVVPGS